VPYLAGWTGHETVERMTKLAERIDSLASAIEAAITRPGGDDPLPDAA